MALPHPLPRGPYLRPWDGDWGVVTTFGSLLLQYYQYHCELCVLHHGLEEVIPLVLPYLQLPTVCTAYTRDLDPGKDPPCLGAE